MEVMASEATLSVVLEEDWVEALEEAVVPAVEVKGFPAASVAVVEADAAPLDRVVQVAAALEAAWAEAKEEVVSPPALTAPEMVMVAPEASDQATAVGQTAASNDYLVSSRSNGKICEEHGRQNCISCE